MYFEYLAGGIDIRAERLGSVRLSGSAEVGLRGDYGAAMRREYADMPVSRRQSGEYLALRRQRRQDLTAILRTGIGDSNRERALDLVGAICAEPAWARRIGGAFDDDAHPVIDLMAARTASLVAWAFHEGGFEVNVRSHLLRELRRRIFMPLIAHDDYACMRPDTPRALTMLCECITAALIVESDTSRRTAFLRRAARAADEIIANGCAGPLSDALKDWVCATALWRVARTVDGNQPLMRGLPTAEWLDTLLFAHLGEGVFIDRLGGGLCAGLNGADIYFLGKTAGDEAVMALGAALYRNNAEELSALSAQLTADYSTEMITLGATAPRFRHAALSDNSIMSARGGGAFVALHIGGRGNAGGMCAYIDNMPALFACDSGSIMLDGLPLSDAPGAGECEFGQDDADISVDMTAACPPDADIRFMQRTAMLDRATGDIRLIDVVESNKPGEITYVFESPYPPARDSGGIRLGTCFFRPDGDVEPKITRREKTDVFPDGTYRIELEYRLQPGSNMLNFIIEHV